MTESCGSIKKNNFPHKLKVLIVKGFIKLEVVKSLLKAEWTG
ncbi:hypothetical protein CLERM_013 [Coxiella-like endosymbiont]|nr:hypothetical protein CLERM_137 [Coxiella-like endosymbiont]PMB54676.1 hypothetical protein CLERM_013 [Coxiella-like endosymbiont]